MLLIYILCRNLKAVIWLQSLIERELIFKHIFKHKNFYQGAPSCLLNKNFTLLWIIILLSFSCKILLGTINNTTKNKTGSLFSTNLTKQAWGSATSGPLHLLFPLPGPFLSKCQQKVHSNLLRKTRNKIKTHIMLYLIRFPLIYWCITPDGKTGAGQSWNNWFEEVRTPLQLSLIQMVLTSQYLGFQPQSIIVWKAITPIWPVNGVVLALVYKKWLI